ncbi:MAG TPA: hypothetical protein VE821_02470, partial [Pyrinomonadaceae bacterium]|nr:hypothetical protein [Pyrinomonadaceae bacterium]
MSLLLWLIPILPLAGAAVNGLLGRKFRFSERLIGAIAVGTVALSFVCAVAAVIKYANSPTWPTPYVTSQDGWSFTWIAGGATEITEGQKERAQAGNTEATGGELRTTTGAPGTSATYGASTTSTTNNAGTLTASRTVK